VFYLITNFFNFEPYLSVTIHITNRAKLLTFGLMYQKKALLLWLQLNGFDYQIKKETIFCPVLLENIEMDCILCFVMYYELSESRNLTLEKKLSQFKPSKVSNMMKYNYRIQLLR
jgi:hypothetical protein